MSTSLCLVSNLIQQFRLAFCVKLGRPLLALPPLALRLVSFLGIYQFAAWFMLVRSSSSYLLPIPTLSGSPVSKNTLYIHLLPRCNLSTTSRRTPILASDCLRKAAWSCLTDSKLIDMEPMSKKITMKKSRDSFLRDLGLFCLASLDDRSGFGIMDFQKEASAIGIELARRAPRTCGIR